MATTTTEVKSAAELERQRLSKQAAQAAAAAKRQAREAGTETKTQAKAAGGTVAQQARAAREEAQKAAAAMQADIRKQQGAAEFEGQAIIGKARQVKAREARKADLPYTKPMPLGISEFIASVDAARKEAHASGRDARAAVKEVKDDYLSQVEEWEKESLISIDQQLKDIQADIAKSLITAKAEIAKQQVNLNAGIKEWESQAMADIAEFESTNIKLDTGEWVDKTLYDKLPPDYQVLLQTVGVDKFNTQVQAEVKDFESKHIEIKPELWVNKVEWGKLTPAQKQEVIKTGQYTVIPDASTALQQLKDAGKIPTFAKLKDYDPDTGEVTYTIPPFKDIPKDELAVPANIKGQLREDILHLDTNMQLALTDKILGKDYSLMDTGDGIVAIPVVGIPSKVTTDQMDKIVGYYYAIYHQSGDKNAALKELQRSYKTKTAEQLKGYAIGLIPIYGTIYHWDNMSPTWRGISIALDIACIVPLIKAAGHGIKAATMAIKTKISPIRTAATTLAKAELAMSDDMARILKQAYSTRTKLPGLMVSNQKLANSYTKMIKAQGDYLKVLGRQADLLNKGRVVPGKLKTAIVGYESKLRISANDFVRKLYGSNSQLRGVKDVPIRFDSPEVARLMNSLPTEMVQNTKMAISGLQLKTTNIKALTQAVDKAAAALKAAQTKHPTAPSKWVDLMYDLTKAQGRLAQAQTGSVTKLHNDLLAASNAGRAAEAAKLQQQLDQAINAMEIEWGRLGFNRGGKVGVATTKPLSPTYSPAAPAQIGSKISVNRAAVSAIRLLSAANPQQLGEWATPGGSSTPEVIAAATEVARTMPKIDGVTNTEIIALTEAALRQSIKSALEGKTAEEIKTDTLNAVKPITNEWVETSPATKTEVKAAAKTAVKVATKTAKDLKLIQKIKKSIPLPTAKTTADKGKYPDGTIVWRMGSLKGKRGHYKIIPPPYTMRKPITSATPPKGMTRTEGTPQQTLTFLGGKLPFNNVSFDLGVTDGFIDVKSKTIKFTGQGQKTNVGTRLAEKTRGVALTNQPPLLQQLAKKKGKARGKRMPKDMVNVNSRGRSLKSNLSSKGVYTDRKGERISRKQHRGWHRIY